MYIKSIALFAAVYGRGALAQLTSCEADGGATTCPECSPLNTEYEPPQSGEIWYSSCCSVSETSTADPPVTTTKQFCYSWKLKGYPSNLYAGTLPECKENAAGNLGWTLNGECQTDTAAVVSCLNYSITVISAAPVVSISLSLTLSLAASVSFSDLQHPYRTSLTDEGGCPAQYDSSKTYAAGDKVEDNQTVYTCGQAAFCNVYAPNLRDVGSNYWTPTGKCAGTATPTAAPMYAITNPGCPAEYDTATSYDAGDKVSVERDDGVKLVYQCKTFPMSSHCKDSTYSPTNTALQCNGGVCWPTAWTKIGACTGTFTPTAAPTFVVNQGCPEEYTSGTKYTAGDRVTIKGDGEIVGKIYQCKNWPNSAYCEVEAYKPGPGGSVIAGTPIWMDGWSYVGGCEGTITPTASPTFSGITGGCPEEFVSGADYVAGDKVSIKGDGDTVGKIYQCKPWPSSGHCKRDEYKPGPGGSVVAGNPIWKDAWTYVSGCTGTITPTSAPIFSDISGCPEDYSPGTDYEAGDKVTIKGDGEAFGKIYKCKPWPQTGFCKLEAYKPGSSGDVWKEAWTYEGGCTGTITPTAAPVFVSIPQWSKLGCPEEYIPNNPNYFAGDHVTVDIKGDGKYGIVYMCKNEQTYPWCRLEGYAPGSQYSSRAWERVGHCDGTMAPTQSPVLNTGACQFKKTLPSSTSGEYVILQAGDWENNGNTVATASGGMPLTLYKPGDLVRSGTAAFKCNPYPYSGYCIQFSPLTQDRTYYSPLLSPQAWTSATCDDVVSDITSGSGKDDEFKSDSGNLGPVFASNGDVLVGRDGNCKYDSSTSSTPAYSDSGATNPGDYFKTSPTVKGCQQCDSTTATAPTPQGTGVGFGFGDTHASPRHSDLCTECMVNTKSQIVNGKSQCVCDNGATDPWGLDLVDTTSDQCEQCPGGKRYLGLFDDASHGLGKCVDSCPTSHPYYSTFEDATDSNKKYKVCCATRNCPEGRSGCYDGGATDASAPTPMPVCYHASEVPSLSPSESPSDDPSESPSDLPSDVPSNVPSDVPSESPSLSSQPSLI